MSTLRNDLIQTYHTATPEQKLKILRQELQGPVITVREVAALLEHIDPELCESLPPSIKPGEFEHLVQWLAAAGRDMQETLDALAPEEPGLH